MENSWRITLMLRAEMEFYPYIEEVDD